MENHQEHSCLSPESIYQAHLARLHKRYLDILSRTDFTAIYDSAFHDKLSGVFLARPTPHYFASGRKIIVIGQEPKGWRDDHCPLKNKMVVNLSAITEATVAPANENRKAGRSAFLRFYQIAGKTLSRATNNTRYAAVWANQFCISYSQASPMALLKKKHGREGREVFKRIAALSSELLQAQFEVLQPDIAFFTVGAGRDRFIKECFPDRFYSEAIVPKRLWTFNTAGTMCFRTNHPRWRGSAPFLRDALVHASKSPLSQANSST